MFNLFFSIIVMTSLIMLKFDFYFSQFIYHDNRVLTGIVIGLGSFMAIKLNAIIWGVFAESNGPFGKFVHSTVLITALLLMIFIPFDNMQEFMVRFGAAFALMAVPLYFLFKRLYHKHAVNYSLIDILNNKFRMVFESSLFMAFMTSLFLLYVDSKNDNYNTIVMGMSVYFSIVFLLSILVRFNVARHIIINSVAFYIFAFFIVSGSYEQAKYTDYFLVGGCVWLFVCTIYDVCLMIKFLFNPVQFLKDCQIPELAKSMFSVRPDSGIDYFKYFKHVKIGKTFIHYKSLLNRIDCVFYGDYSIIKNMRANEIPEDRLFHINEKAIQPRKYMDFYKLSRKRLDEHADIDHFAFTHIPKINAYLAATGMNYNELTDADLQVIDMFTC